MPYLYHEIHHQAPCWPGAWQPLATVSRLRLGTALAKVMRLAPVGSSPTGCALPGAYSAYSSSGSTSTWSPEVWQLQAKFWGCCVVTRHTSKLKWSVANGYTRDLEFLHQLRHPVFALAEGRGAKTFFALRAEGLLLGVLGTKAAVLATGRRAHLSGPLGSHRRPHSAAAAACAATLRTLAQRKAPAVELHSSGKDAAETAPRSAPAETAARD